MDIAKRMDRYFNNNKYQCYGRREQWKYFGNGEQFMWQFECADTGCDCDICTCFTIVYHRTDGSMQRQS